MKPLVYQRLSTVPGLKQQRGIAMLTALLLTALAVTIVSTIYVQQHYSIRLSSNFQDLEQSYQYAHAAEELAGVWLKRDNTSNQHDSIHDAWAADIRPLEIDDDEGQQIGEMRLKITDLQAYINLNNVLDTEGKPHEKSIAVLENLLRNTDIPPVFAYSILDWVDEDDQLANPESAEADYYLTEDPGYRTANSLLVDKSELHLLKMASISDPQERKERLKPLLEQVITLPTPTSVNVNNASAEVLTAVGLSNEQISAIGSRRQSAPIENEQMLKATVQGISDDSLQYLGFSSNYFHLTGELRLGKSRLFLDSTLFRAADGTVSVIARRFSRLKPPKRQQ